jgi:hypothetical protein
MKIKSKFPKPIDYSKVELSEEDDSTLNEMKLCLSVIHRHYANKLKNDNMDEKDTASYAQTCESFARIVEEQRKRQMLKAHIKT